jgi:hypothetical protein
MIHRQQPQPTPHNFVSRLIVSFVLQDRISCTHNKHLTTEVGSGQNKDGNAGLAAEISSYLRDGFVSDYSGFLRI